jgi:GT2 family glycosyltransferase
VLAVVIVTFSAEPEMLQACLASVAAGGDVDRVIVVDNGATAGVPIDVECVRPSRNLGYGGGANAGFRRAAELGATAIALINDDVVVEPGWLRPLIAALHDDAAIGAVQPKLLVAGTDPARVNSVGVEIDAHGAGRDIGYDEADGPQFEEARPIAAFTGGAVLFRAAFIDATGGFDDSYFLYYEDLDLARRGSALGWTYLCVPASRVWHRVSASTTKLGERARYLQERNRLRFVFRFGEPAGMARALWLSIRRLRWSPRTVHARALLAGLGSAPRALLARFRARKAKFPAL